LMTQGSMYQLTPGSLISVIVGCCASDDTLDEVSNMGRATGITVRKATRLADRYALAINPP
jgi:hypothetical protein